MQTNGLGENSWLVFNRYESLPKLATDINKLKTTRTLQDELNNMPWRIYFLPLKIVIFEVR